MSIAAASELNPHVAINSCHIRGRKLTPGGGEIGLTRQFKRRPNAAWSRSRFAVNCHSDWKRSLKVASESGHSAGRPDGSALSPAGSNIDDFASLGNPAAEQAQGPPVNPLEMGFSDSVARLQRCDCSMKTRRNVVVCPRRELLQARFASTYMVPT